MAATNQNGDVVGFVAARKMIMLEEGWKLAPLFADNAQIARVLLKIIFKGMLTNAADRKIALFELYADATALAEELNAQPLFDMSRMFTKGPLEFKKDKVFGCCAAELG